MRGCCRRCLRVPSCLGDRAVDVSVDRRCLRHRKWASARVLDCRMSLEPYSNAEWNAEIRSRIGSRTAELWRFERASYFVAALGAEPEVVARCGLALWIDEKKIFPMSCLSTSWDRKCGVWSVGKPWVFNTAEDAKFCTQNGGPLLLSEGWRLRIYSGCF